MRPVTIAIDGPAGAGKSTVARAVARRLGLLYIDTGAMYRGVALLAMRQGVQVDDAERLTALAAGARFAFADSPEGQRVLVNGEDVTDAIRSPEATRLSSPVSAVPGVRRALVALQQHMGRDGGVVMEGRDIGTVVFPHAEVKVFLTASPMERARRRCRELQARGQEVTTEEVMAAQQERDARDSSRADSPLAPARDAAMIDTDNLDIDQVIDRVAALAARHGEVA